MNAEERAENFMQTREFCIVCRATAETYPAPRGWRKWESTDGGVDRFYMFSTCPHCSKGITERHRISALDELSERVRRAVGLANEYLEDEESLVREDPFTAGTCQVASELLAILTENRDPNA